MFYVSSRYHSREAAAILNQCLLNFNLFYSDRENKFSFPFYIWLMFTPSCAPADSRGPVSLDDRLPWVFAFRLRV